MSKPNRKNRIKSLLAKLFPAQVDVNSPEYKARDEKRKEEIQNIRKFRKISSNAMNTKFDT